MAHTFRGFFTTSTKRKIIDEARIKWVDIWAKTIASPFAGTVIAAPNAVAASDSDKFVRVDTVNTRIIQQLPEFSKLFPDTAFAFVEVDCWGGYCSFSGYAVCNGEKIIHINPLPASAAQKEQYKNLSALLTLIGASLNRDEDYQNFGKAIF